MAEVVLKPLNRMKEAHKVAVVNVTQYNGFTLQSAMSKLGRDGEVHGGGELVECFVEVIHLYEYTNDDDDCEDVC